MLGKIIAPRSMVLMLGCAAAWGCTRAPSDRGAGPLDLDEHGDTKAALVSPEPPNEPPEEPAEPLVRKEDPPSEPQEPPPSPRKPGPAKPKEEDCPAMACAYEPCPPGVEPPTGCMAVCGCSGRTSDRETILTAPKPPPSD
jgi:hypothetical protein